MSRYKDFKTDTDYLAMNIDELKRLEDIQLAKIVEERLGQKEISVELSDSI